MQTFKKLSSARKAAGTNAIIQIARGGDSLYIVLDGQDEISQRLTEVSVINASGVITGHVTLGHLDRLGNANWAKSGERKSVVHRETAFPNANPLREPVETTYSTELNRR